MRIIMTCGILVLCIIIYRPVSAFVSRLIMTSIKLHLGFGGELLDLLKDGDVIKWRFDES